MVGGRVEGEKYIVTVQRDWNFERLGHLETSGGRAGTLWIWADRLAGWATVAVTVVGAVSPPRPGYSRHNRVLAGSLKHCTQGFLARLARYNLTS